MYDALQAELDDAEAAQMTAEAAAVAAMAAQTMAEAEAEAAMEAQMMAETAQMMAETAQEAAEAAQMMAEQQREAARIAEAIAMQAEADAKEALMDAEAQRDMYQQGQMDAEAQRDMYQQAKMDADAKLEAAEEARMMAVEAADTAKAAEMAADEARQMAEDRANEAEAATLVARQAEQDAKDALKIAQDRIAELEGEEEETDAEKEAEKIAEKVAQRARVDARAIGRSSGSSVTTWDDEGGNDDGIRDLNELTTVITGPEKDFQSSEDKPTAMELTAANDGSMVTFKVTKGMGKDKEEIFSFMVPAADSGETSGMTVEEDLPGGHDKYIYLMTDIMPAGSVPFPENPDGLDERVFHAATQMFRYSVEDTDGDTDGLQNDDMDIDPGTLAPSDQVPERSVLENASFDGTFADSPGMYICTDTEIDACEFGRDDDGDLTVDGEWSFVPSDSAPDPDTDYHVYGAWLKKPDSTAGTGYSAALGTGNDLFTAANIVALVGKAKYSGKAVGFFAERRVDTEGAVSGTFTAMAELNADFDADTPGGTADDSTTVSGMITGFERSDGGDANWLVELDMIRIANSPAPANDGGFAGGDTMGHASGTPWDGAWGVQFTGNGPDVGAHPSGVVGTFGAEHGSPDRLVGADETAPDTGFVGVIGGFGAKKVVE
jgi:hypothetical protein